MNENLIALGFIFFALAKSDTLSELDKAKTAYDSAFVANFRKSFVEEGVKSCMRTTNQGEKVRQSCECVMTTFEKGLSDDDVFSLSIGNGPKDMMQRIDKVIAVCK